MNKAKEESKEKIKIERHGHNLSPYYVDANSLLKGEWGGFRELPECGFNGEAMFEIKYKRFNRYVPINEYGYFYNRFSCKKYDGIIKISVFDLYICEKDGRLGLINADEKCIFPTEYNRISPFIERNRQKYHYLLAEGLIGIEENDYDKIFFIITNEAGKFLYNIGGKKKSDTYDSIFVTTIDSIYDHIIYKSEGKYGVLDTEGKILLKSYYDFSTDFSTRRDFLYYTYQGTKFSIRIENGLLYGFLPCTEYDVCFKIQNKGLSNNNVGNFYIYKKDNKYGIISINRKFASNPVLDEVILYHPYYFKENKGSLRIELMSLKKFVSFIITRVDNKYMLFDLENGELILDHCDIIKYKYIFIEKYEDITIIEFTKEGIMGYVLWNKRIVSTAEYEEVNAIQGLIRTKKGGKYGIINTAGMDLYPCVYDSINISRWGYTLVKDGKEEKKRYHSKNTSNYYCTYEKPTYEKYSGSYAQDEMGYSDNDIDTIFDGDPDAYWNID